MRSFRHLTPRYIKNRLVELYYHYRHPDHPWLTPAAICFLASWLKESDDGVEFGSGRSTLWLARRTRHLISIEHNPAWHQKVEQMLADAGQTNVEYHLIPKDVAEEKAGESAYLKVLERFAENSLDYALVDGIYRDHCALKAIRLIRPGGALIIDNANWYLPSHSQAPNSRSFEQGAKGETWAHVEQALVSWRRVWTSSGIFDTAIFIKPCG